MNIYAIGKIIFFETGGDNSYWLSAIRGPLTNVCCPSSANRYRLPTVRILLSLKAFLPSAVILNGVKNLGAKR